MAMTREVRRWILRGIIVALVVGPYPYLMIKGIEAPGGYDIIVGIVLGFIFGEEKQKRTNGGK